MLTPAEFNAIANILSRAPLNQTESYAINAIMAKLQPKTDTAVAEKTNKKPTK